MNKSASISFVAVCSLAMTLAGCRDVDPQPVYYADLGDEGKSLLPTSTVPYDPRVKTGTAEWKAFEAPGAKSAKKSDDDAAPNADSDAPSPEETIEEIKGLIDEFNEHITKKEYDETIDFYVEAQRKAAESIGETAKGIDKLVEELQAALIEKWPDGKARVESLFTRMYENSGARVIVTELKVVSDTEVEGKLPPIPGLPPTVTFRLLPDKEANESYWYIDSPILADFEKFKPLLDAGKAMYSGMLEQVKGGGMSPEQIVQTLETTLKAMEAMLPQQADGDKPKAPAAETDAAEKPKSDGE